MPKTGEIVGGKYRVGERLGAGGMGVVFEGVHLGTSRNVALKWLSPELAGNQEAVARFKREAHATGRIEHPNVVAIYDIGEHEGELYLVMELLRGQTLRARLQQGSMPLEQACRVLVGIARGLEAAHAAGVLHRDLKPDNVYLSDRDVPKLLDFGLAKLHSETIQTATGSLLGTYQYMAPEQMYSPRDVDARADLYSLGVIAFELLTGTLPYKADNLVDLALHMHQAEAPRVDQLVPSIPRKLADAIAKAIAKERDARFASAAEMAAAFQPHTMHTARETASIHTEKTRTRIALPTRRRSAPAWLAGGLLLMGGAVAVLWPRGGETPSAPVPPQPAAPKSAPAQVQAAPSASATDDWEADPPPAQPAPPPSEPAPDAQRALDVVPAAPVTEPPPPATNTSKRTARALLEVFVLPYGDVWIDGVPRGQAPLKVRLAPGTHEVAVGDGKPTTRRTVTLRAGERTALEVHRESGGK